MKKIFILIIALLGLSGCYNYRELSDLAIMTAVAIDRVDDSFQLTIQVVNPKKQQDSSNANQPDFVIYTTKDKSLQKAFRKVVNMAPKRAYAAHLQLLVLSEKVATDYTDEIVDFFIREPEVRDEFQVLVAKGSEASDKLEVITPLTTLSSMDIFNTLDSNKKYLGSVSSVTFNDFMHAYLDPNTEMVLPVLEIVGDSEEGKKQENVETSISSANLKLASMAIFKDNKLVKILDEDDSINLNMLLGELNETIIQYECGEDKYAAFEIISSDSELEVDPEKNKAIFTITGHASVNEVQCALDLRKIEVGNKMREELNKTIKNALLDTINTIRNDYNTDVFGIKDSFYKHYPDYFKKIDDKWYDEVFPNLDIDVDVSIRLYEKGNILGGTEYDKREN